jgi:Tat protein secretion system quality control protein TatD with DNase activity
MARKSSATRHSELAGAPPQLATVQDLQGANEPLTGHGHARQTSYSTKAGAQDLRHRINLKAVAEACIDEGLDPAVEITKALNKQIPLFRNGAQVFDDNGLPVMVHLVDADTRLRTLNELLQYTQPKLKAVEVKMSGSLELSSDQLDQRLASLLAKAARA